jgi:hypothetical protein
MQVASCVFALKSFIYSEQVYQLFVNHAYSLVAFAASIKLFALSVLIMRKEYL